MILTEIHTTRLSREHCIVLPHAVRRVMKLQEGEEVAIVIEGGKIYLEKVDSSASKRPKQGPELEDEFREGTMDDDVDGGDSIAGKYTKM